MEHGSFSACELRLKHRLFMDLKSVDFWTRIFAIGSPVSHISSPGFLRCQLQILRFPSLQPREPIYIQTFYWFCFFREPWLIHKLEVCQVCTTYILNSAKKNWGNTWKLLSDSAKKLLISFMKDWSSEIYLCFFTSVLLLQINEKIHRHSCWNYTHLLMQL